MPGTSGSGKSSLTCWLIANGFQYLTDELIFLSSQGKIQPMTRPISLKINHSHDLWPLSVKASKDIISCKRGAMIPHRLLNPVFQAQQPLVSNIVFPRYKPKAALELKAISPAKSSLYLLQSHVNARNLDGHGVSELTSIAKRCKSFKLTYGNFSDLETILSTQSCFF